MTEAERNASRAVLGAMILDPNAMVIGLSALREDAMVGPEAVTLKAIRRLSSAGSPADAVLVHRELERSGELMTAGGPHALTELMDYGCALGNLEMTCQVVNLEATRRALKTGCLRTLADIDTIEVPELLDRTEAELLGIRESKELPVMEPLALVLERAMLQAGKSGLRTGYRKFDWATGGMQAGQLITIGARPGVGKTAIAVAIAETVARQGHPVAFLSLEMDSREIAERLISRQGVPLTRVGYGGTEVEAAALSIRTLPITLMHMIRPTLTDLRAALRRMKPAPMLVIVDYLQLVHPGRRYENRSEAVDQVTVGLKWLARELKLPVLALAQLNRNTEERGKLRRPVLSDLRESGGIEAHSDVVGFLHRPKYYDPADTSAELIIAKNRQGPMAISELVFRGQYASFENPAVVEAT